MGLRIDLSGWALAAMALVAFTTDAQAALVISTAPTANVSCTSSSCTQGPRGASVLNVMQLRTMLASSSVAVHAKIDLAVDAEITWASASTLTLDAPGTVIIKKPIAVAGAGGLALDIGNANAPTFGPKGNVNFWSTASSLAITLAGPTRTVIYTPVTGIAALASAIAANPTGNYALANSYDASHDGVYSASPIPTFGGNFTGLNNTISHLSITDKIAGHQVGLFGETDNASLTWLNLADVKIHGANNSAVGGIAGTNRDLLIDNAVSGTVSTGKSAIGGAQDAVAGGLVGVNYGNVQLSHADGNIAGGKNAIIGGVVGENATTSDGGGGGVAAVYSTAAVTLNGGDCKGCKIGKPENSAGGLVGVNSGFVVTSYATGSVTGGASTNLGGLIGFENSASTFQVTEAYSTGAVAGGTGSSVGGAIGFDKTQGLITDFYWDTTTSNIAAQGSGNVGNDAGVTGLTTAQLQAAMPAGFDNRVWGQDAAINSGLPYLVSIPRS